MEENIKEIIAEAEENLSSWLENPYWKKFYEEAPTESCKRYVVLEFYYSDTEDEEVLYIMNMISEEFDVNDWLHILKYTKGPKRVKIQKRIDELMSS